MSLRAAGILGEYEITMHLIATGESIPLLCVEGVSGLPGAPQDDAGLTRKFETAKLHSCPLHPSIKAILPPIKDHPGQRQGKPQHPRPFHTSRSHAELASLQAGGLPIPSGHMTASAESGSPSSVFMGSDLHSHIWKFY